MSATRPFSNSCPINSRTADGDLVGRCWHFVGSALRCPAHGDVTEAVLAYRETGRLTPEPAVAPTTQPKEEK